MIHNQVEPIVTQYNTLVTYLQRHLLIKWNLASYQFMPKGHLVDVFCKTRTKCIMNLKSNLKERIRQCRIYSLIIDRFFESEERDLKTSNFHLVKRIR